MAFFRIVACASLALGASPSSPFDASFSAWQRGDYIPALNGFIQILNGAGGDEYLQRIALLTGELYRTDELTADGRAGRFSPDGRYILYETGLETSRRTKILRNDRARAVVAELPGISATFTPDGSRVAYLRVNETADVARAAADLDAATLTQSTRGALVNTLAWTIARDSTIVVRDMASAHEIELPAPGLVKSSLRYAADGRTLFFLGARDGDAGRNDIYTVFEGAAAPALAVDAGGFKSAPLIDAGGAALVYVIPNVNPLQRPAAPGSAGRSGGPGRSNAPAGPPRPPSTFAILDLGSKAVSVVTGTAPTLSADGKTLAYVARNGAEYQLMAGPTLGMQAAIKKTTERIDAPALSDDGRAIAWQMMPRDDWEIFVGAIDGSTLDGERRITREIQHDVLPRFVAADKLIAMIGEPRHRRSYLYDLAGGGDSGVVPRVRLFHNNTVRTIAPEYQWSASPDGTNLIVGAERDGDTVDPARGVYLMDLRERVTKADLLTRLRENLKRETALKSTGVKAFAPIAADVRQVLSRASVDRVFGYEKALYDFDSKNITQPGNAKASQFLFDTYQSFGYEPEFQYFSPRNAAGGRTANVVATLRGTVNPELIYVISSHYDSVEAGPGADDDSSGTAALLEAARMLAGHPLPATVMFASMTGEEGGLLGSREFVRLAVAQKLKIAGVLNNDMIGWMNDERMDNTIRYSNPGIRDIQHAAAMQFTKLITFDALYWKGTDAMSFYDVYGDVIGGIGSYPVLGSPYYHQRTDLLENENHQLITETSKTTAATIMLLASSPSRLTNLRVESYAGGAATLSWTPSPEKGVVSYVVSHGTARVVVTEPRATIPVPRGTTVAVKALNARGLESWDSARVVVQ
jgi:Tol biopolymer transport system component